jgi:phosphatidylglycerol:prolipoprotein diacylglycerol transferase
MNIILFCIISIIAIFTLLIIRYKKYHISLLKTFVITLAIAIAGLLGSYIMFFLENGVWYGRSMFGGILLFPLFLFPISLMLKIEPSDLFDYATIPGAFMLAFSKFNCYLAGCCDGKVIGYVNAIPNFFPSQLVEMSVSLLIVILLFVLECKNKIKHLMCPVCIVLYSITRFILDFFRWSQENFALGMTAGRFWSVISFLIGIIWIVIKMRRKQGLNEKESPYVS